ncbi:MAG TPA: hypothetical protein VF549_21145 [Solirubrobacteraceae bacterium]|jgi:hypothetical protein
MKPLSEGQLVTVADGDTRVDGIVFHVESFLKAEVAVPDGDGAAFRTVHRKDLSERTEAGEHDETLRKLIRRTPSGARSGGGGGGGAGRGSRGHSRGADHRSTGR